MLRIELRQALIEAQKARNSLRTATLRLAVSALKESDRVQTVEQGKEELSDSEILLLLQGMIKQRNESVRTYIEAERPDLVAKEEAEISILQEFLPQALSESELDAAIEAILAELRQETPELPKSAMGQVMKALKAEYPGRVDMTVASGRVKMKL